MILGTHYIEDAWIAIGVGRRSDGGYGVFGLIDEAPVTRMPAAVARRLADEGEQSLTRQEAMATAAAVVEASVAELCGDRPVPAKCRAKVVRAARAAASTH